MRRDAVTTSAQVCADAEQLLAMRGLTLCQVSRATHDGHDRRNREEHVELPGCDEDRSGYSGDQANQQENEVGDVEPAM